MRLARVLHGSSPVPLLALERDGALYDAAELDRIFGTRFSPEHIPGASDFHTRAVALGGAGLDELDDRLLAGDRPAAARLLPDTFVWLPPCDTERALYVQMAAYDEQLDDPLHRLGDARSLVGHESIVPFPAGETGPGYALGIAAVLREDIHDATPEEAERAVLGYSVLNAWWGADDEARRKGWGSPRVPAQLGPVLVTPGDLGQLTRLKAQVRVDGVVTTHTGIAGAWFSIGEMIAWASRWVGLRGGDVIGLGRVRMGGGEAAYGAKVEVGVEKIGWLSGQAVPGTAR